LNNFTWKKDVYVQEIFMEYIVIILVKSNAKLKLLLKKIPSKIVQIIIKLIIKISMATNRVAIYLIRLIFTNSI